jgi:DNA-binding CsgD family transcriptional regulator
MQRNIGVLGSLFALGLANSEIPTFPDYMFPFDFPPESLLFVYGIFAALFLSSALIAAFGAIQVFLLFALAALLAAQDPECLDGLGCALTASIVALCRGWFCRRPALKGVVVAVTGSAALLGTLFFRREVLVVPALIGTAVFLLAVAGLARERLLSSLAPKKRILRLADYKLNERESHIVRMRLLGKSVKEIAFEGGIAESTVRNNLSSSYRKLGLNGSEELVALGERYKVI